MVGAYSDNQPDYSWLQPYEVRSFTMNWYPFRDIDGVKKANLDAAVNLDVANGVAKLGFCTTSAHAAAKISLKAGGKVLLDQTVAIDPGKPWTGKVPVPAGIDEHDLVASISDGGMELVSYSPIRLQPEATPKPVTTPPAPAEVKSSEELYLIGLRAEQFHDPSIDPLPYWQEALRRDPGDVRVNTVLGIDALRKARYDEAAALLRKALDRATDKYTDPKDGEAFYYLGAVLQAQGKTAEAYTQFYKATWSEAWKAAGYFSLAEIAASRGEMSAALDFANHSLDSNALNIRALNLKAAALRHLGRSQEALQLLATASRRADPLDVRTMAERWLASKDPAAAKILATNMNNHPATAQETAAEYLDEGMWQDGSSALLQMTAAAPDKTKINAMVYYYLGYFAGKLGDAQKASEYYKQAMAMPPDYVFPFQNEAIGVLRAAIEANPRDARAPYYLGDLLYDWQPEEATRLWQASEALDPSYAIVHRNLATAYMHLKPAADIDKAIAELEQAVSKDRKYALHFTEIDELYEQARTPIEKRLALFEKNQDVVAQRDDAQNRAIALKVAAGKLDEAIAMMTGRPFASVEGVNLNVAEHWADAHILRGQQEVAAKRDKEALADFQAAVNPPSNLPAGLGGGGEGFGGGGGARGAEISYWTGLANADLGDSAKAAASWTQGSTQGGYGGAQSYYQALCLQKLGQNDKAKAMFQTLVDSAQTQLRQPASGAPAGGGRGGRGGGDEGEAPAAARGPATFTEAKRQYDQQIQKINDFFDAARQYQKERSSNVVGFKKDLKMEAMMPVLEGKEPVAISASRERSIHDAILFAEKQHIKVVILQPRELAKTAAELKSHNIPVILGRTEALSENEDDPYDQEMTLPSVAYKAGLKFAFGTFNNEFGRNLPYNAARAVAFGLPYEEALKAITINAAEIWGVADQMGSIDKGKWADLMLTDGDPMELSTQVKGVYIKGKEIELTNHQIELYRRYLARP